MPSRHTWLRLKISVVALLLPAVAAGQPPGDPAGMDRQVKPGQEVIVTERDGQRVRGRVTSIEESGLTLLVGDENGKRPVTLFASSVATVRRNDSLLNGFLIGLGTGLVGGEVWIYSMCGPPGYDIECRAIATPIGWAAFGGGGAAIGALIDKFSTKLLYSASNNAGDPGAASVVGARRLHVEPMVGRKAQGVRVSLIF